MSQAAGTVTMVTAAVQQRMNTVKLLYEDHTTDQQNMVLIDKCSLYAGSVASKIDTCKMWSL